MKRVLVLIKGLGRVTIRGRRVTAKLDRVLEWVGGCLAGEQKVT